MNKLGNLELEMYFLESIRVLPGFSKAGQFSCLTLFALDKFNTIKASEPL